MKKCFYLFAVLLSFGLSAKAAPGDTTWVQANNVQLNYYNNFDTSVVFPHSGVTYRKVLMIFTLGKYACPAGTTYCGSWDYTVSNYVMKPGDTTEISRLITPYATTSTYFPLTWTYDYVYDVTDYISKLQDTATMRIAYSGYSGGFTANVRFAFIEGTPDRNVLGIQRLWHGSFQYGVSTDTITNHVYTVPDSTAANTASTALKMRITGHGEDGNNCNEFCPNTYDVVVNGNDILTQNFWRENCGSNPIYSQTGTWIYDRANWCPGSLVYDINNPLPVTSGNYNIDVTFPSYTTISSTSGNSTPSYIIEAATFNYGAVNKTLDASLDDIIAPSNKPMYNRMNTVCGQPVIHVHNSGSTTITALNINYNLVDSPVYNYTWNGSLTSLHDTDITLPSISEMQAGVGLADTMQFTATIVSVNGQTDADNTNNTLISSFSPSPIWSDKLIIKMKAGNYDIAPNWAIMDMNDNIIAQHTAAAVNELFTDTVTLDTACYKLVVTTTDGAGFKIGTYYTGASADNGYLTIVKYGSSIVSIPNYRGGDFGNGFTQYFATNVLPSTGITTTQTAKDISMEAYPNPARSSVTISLNGYQQVKGTLLLIDAVGRTVLAQTCTSAQQTINVSSLSNGLYTVVFVDNNANGKIQTRLVIAK